MCIIMHVTVLDLMKPQVPPPKPPPKPKTPTPPPREPTPTPPPPSPLPEFITQFFDQNWFMQYFPNCSSSVSNLTFSLPLKRR